MASRLTTTQDTTVLFLSKQGVPGDQYLVMLRHVHETMKERYRALEDDPLGQMVDLRPIVLIVEDVEQLLTVTQHWWQAVGSSQGCPAGDYLRHALRRGHAVEIYVALGAATATGLCRFIDDIAARASTSPVPVSDLQILYPEWDVTDQGTGSLLSDDTGLHRYHPQDDDAAMPRCEIRWPDHAQGWERVRAAEVVCR